MTSSSFGTAGFGATPRNGSAAVTGAKPTAAFPGRIATDADLTIGVDRLQTALAATLDNVSLTMTVVNASLIVANMQLSIDNEIVRVTAAPIGNQVAISRAFDNTTAAVHLSGAPVSGYITAWHHNALVSEVEAVETALGINLSNLSTSVFVINTPFNFAAQSPGGSLIVGANTITLSPVPAGVNGVDTGHALYISGGTGTAEAATIIGGTAVAGAPSGTLIIQCANTHSGAWTIQSASGGIQEALCSLPANGGQVWVVANVTLYANVTPCGKTTTQVRKMAGITISGAFTILNAAVAGTPEQIFTGPPNWTTAGIYDSLRSVVGNFPQTNEYGGGTLPVVQSIVGAVAVPNGAVSGTQAFGVAGYSKSGSVSVGSVAVAGFSQAGINGSALWGANFGVTNCSDPTCAGTVYQQNDMWGVEVNVDAKVPAPSYARGIEIVGSSTTKALNWSYALSVRAMGINGTPKITWDYALYSQRTAADKGIHLDAVSDSNNVQSQLIEMVSVDTAGNLHTATIVEDATGDLILRSGASGGLVSLTDSAGGVAGNFGSTGIVSFPNLPSTAPPAGSKQLWYDPTDSNRVKFVP